MGPSARAELVLVGGGHAHVPRFATLGKQQEAVIGSFLDAMAFDERSVWQQTAMQVLEEYWVPGALYRR